MKVYMKILLFVFFFAFVFCTNDNANVENVEIQESYNTMLRVMTEQNQNDTVNQLEKQIIIWSTIGLIFILYFSVVALVDMPIQKSSILYAKYGSNKGQQNQ